MIDTEMPIPNDSERKLKSNLFEVREWMRSGNQNICPNCGKSVPQKNWVWCSHDCRDAVTMLCGEYGYPAWPRWSVLARWQGIEYLDVRCALCDQDGDMDLDHILALGLGGLDHLFNWQFLCRPCHKKKTAIDLRDIFHRKSKIRVFGKNQLNLFGKKVIDVR